MESASQPCAVKGTLKDLPMKLQTASKAQRRHLFHALTNVVDPEVIERSEIPVETVIKGICRVLPAVVLPRYMDAQSRRLANDLVSKLVSVHHDLAVKALSSALHETLQPLGYSMPTASGAKMALAALRWTQIIMQAGFEGLMDKMVDIHFILAYAIFVAAPSPTCKLHKVGVSILHKCWHLSDQLVALYREGLLKAPLTNQNTILATQFFHWLVVEKRESAELKKALLDSTLKNILGSKSRIPDTILQCMKPFLMQITHDEFKSLMLPCMTKAMLRNPEIVVSSISHIISGLSLDLSQYANELGKAFATQLHAKDDSLRDEAVQAVGVLAKQTSDAGGIQSLLEIIFGVLNGSEGKLSVNTQKMSLLHAGGLLSSNAVIASSMEPLCSLATELFVKTLESELHEGTLILALDMQALWAAKFKRVIPPKFVDWLPKGMKLKSTTSSVRSAYLRCLLAALSSGAEMPRNDDIDQMLIKTLEQCNKQPSQALVVTEGAHATACLLKMSQKDDIDCVELSKLLNPNSQVLTSDRFLLAANGSTLRSLTFIAEKMISNHDCQERWFRVLAVALTSNYKDARSSAQASIRRLLSVLEGPRNAVSVVHALAQLGGCSAVQMLGFTDAKQEPNDAGGNRDFSASSPLSIKACHLITALTIVSKSVRCDSSEANELAKALIVPAHLPRVHQCQRRLWSKLLKNMALVPDTFVRACLPDVLQMFRSQVALTEELAIKEMAQLAPAAVVLGIVRLLVEVLDSKDLLVRPEDFAIYMTPDGEVFDKSVLTQLTETREDKNIKRENKAYSYKEQMEELELRKELEEKKRREGKLTDPKLTPKQVELLNAQKEKEAAIRAHLKEVMAQVKPVMDMAMAALSASPKICASAMVDSNFVRVIFNALQSPLVSRQLCHFWFQLRKAVFDVDQEDGVAQRVACVTLMLHHPPEADLCFQWAGSQENLKLSMNSIVGLLHESYAVSNLDEAEDAKLLGPMSTPAFHYVFPLLKRFFELHLERQSEDDSWLSLMHRALSLISIHVALRGHSQSHSDHLVDELHPRYLPHGEMLATLMDVITGCSEARTRQMAVNVMVEVAGSCSGHAGCATAGENELNILLSALQNQSSVARDAALRALVAIKDTFGTFDDSLKKRLTHRLWVSRFDPSDENRTLTMSLWGNEQLLPPSEDLMQDLLSDLLHPVECVRSSTAEALAQLYCSMPDSSKDISDLVQQLIRTYDSKLEMSLPVTDSLGRIIIPAEDFWEPRSGVANAFCHLAPFMNDHGDLMKKVSTFFVHKGLSDRNSQVRTDMLKAAVVTINLHGKDTAEELLPIFEDFLKTTPSDGRYDNVRQSVVILMGSLAKHLGSDDPKIRPIMSQLIRALNTPSQQVQEAVANCLPPLVPTIKEEAPEIVNTLLSTLLGHKNSYGERKGAAYGLAGFVKGLGILSLKQLDIMSRLTEAVTDKKHANHREGALFAFEMLCQMLGRLFEPYIVHMLPHLLLCFGDPVDHVRQAADDTAKAVMSKLSAHGVKLVLPSLLNALEEDQWRTKTGSVELLGAMAYCAPKQLSSCLPAIVPKLIEVLGDSHHKVQRAGAQALKIIGSVIRNPEIQAIVPVLLNALQDPAKKTGLCLQTLLDTKFVHFIDAPSLALIMPVVQRAFQDRSTETRKMAAQIIGNMYSLTDHKDLSPYLPGIIPGLKTSLLDPVPDVRAVSARALGAMVRGMGESSFEELLPWLMATLTSEQSSVDRSGAAQGLAEVVGGLGVEKMNALMPEIIRTAERQDIAPYVKDGYIMMFIYMPSVFPEEFTQYIGQIICPVLRALADENEFVRETAYKAGQRLVIMYADSAISLLLPELERGLFDDNWRIRHSSVQLLGDLLFKISGVSGKMTTETAGDDDNFGTEQSQKAICRRLGVDRSNRVLAGLYMGRSDVALMVRQASLHVWKVIVNNTPKTLREILPTLFNLLLNCLASSSYDKRQIAARTLGDLVKKLGERVLPDIIPILERGLESEQPETRQGVCVGLSEIMCSTSREMVLTFVSSLVPTVRRALCDQLPEVRKAAAKTFDSLHNTVGSVALDDILPPMLKQLDSCTTDSMEYANTLDGLRQVMSIKARAVLPYLIPQLIAPPVNTRALASLAPVAGEALHRHLPKIMPALLDALAANEKVLEDAEAVALSISDDHSDIGIGCFMEEILACCSKKKDVKVQRAAVTLLHSFCNDTKCDLSPYLNQLLRSLILMFTSKDSVVLQQSNSALAAIIKTLDADQLKNVVADVRQAVRFAVADMWQAENESQNGLEDHSGLLLPGFCLAKGIQPILPVFREALLNGKPELKEQAAIGLSEVIRLTTEEALKPSVVHITGPLIRILGDRFSHTIKTAVLDTLAVLLDKAGALLKPFFPQLQTTFMKALNDTNRTVRLKAGLALSYLMVIHIRPDPLFNELHSGVKSSDETAIRDTYLQALRGCLEPAGSKMSPPIRRQLLSSLLTYEAHPEDTTRTAACGCIGALCKWLPDQELEPVISEHLMNDDPNSMDWTLRHGRSVGLFVGLKLAPQRIYDGSGADRKSKLVSIIKAHLAADRISIAQNGVRSGTYLIQYLIESGQPMPSDLMVPFAKSMNHHSNEVKLVLTIVSAYLAKKCSSLPAELLKPLLPMLVNGTKEKNSAVRSSSESALVAILRMRDQPDVTKQTQQMCLQLLDLGARDVLSEVIGKVLQKVANQPEGKQEVIDDSILI